MSLKIDALRLEDITPQNIISDKNALNVQRAIDSELSLVSSEIPGLRIFSRIDELNTLELDALARQFHADFYDLAGNIDMKREVVKSVLTWHMKKGTVKAILDSLKQLDIDAQFVPWWESGDKPYTFRLKAIVAGDFYRTVGKDKLIENIKRAVNESKAARSYMAGLETVMQFHEDMNFSAGLASLLSGHELIRPGKIELPKDIKLYISGVNLLSGQMTVRYEGAQNSLCLVYSGIARSESIDFGEGLEEGIMQELLLRFEERIFRRLDEHETRIMSEMNARQADIDARLEKILELLTWQPENEEIENE